MVGAGPCTFAVWGYVIANCKNGTVEINPTILAAILGATKEDVEKAIEYLSAPDPESRSKVLDGRRIVKVGAFFYEVPNHATYRGIINDEERREYFRDKKREQREREAKDKEVTQPRKRLSLTVKDKSKVSTQSEASSYADAEGDADAKESKICRAEGATKSGFIHSPETRESRMNEIYMAYPRPKTGEHRTLGIKAIERAMLRLVQRNPDQLDEDSAFDFLLSQARKFSNSAETKGKLVLQPEMIPMAKNWFDGQCYDNEGRFQ